MPFYATGISPVGRYIFQEVHFSPADTAQSSSSETQNPEASLGTESDSEVRDDSKKEGD